MQGRRIIALLVAAFCLPAHADFPAALGQYQAGRYTVAKREFQRLAGLGNSAAQLNLGVMALHGQGGPADRGEASGWFIAARENGSRDVSEAQLAELQSTLTPADQARAARIVATYGHVAMAANVLPLPSDAGQCARFRPPVIRVEAPAPYAYAAREVGVSGVGVVSYLVGTDGIARDPILVAAMPAPPFGQPAVDSILNSRFAPALADGKPVDARNWSHVGIRLKAGVASIWSPGILAGLKAAAARGDLPSLYLYGVIARLDPSLGEAPGNAEAIILEAAQAGNTDAQFWIAMELEPSRRCGIDRALPWLRAAAEGGHDAARVMLGERLLEGEPGPARVAEAKALFASVAGSTNAWALKHAIAHLAASPREALRDAPAALRATDTLFVKGRNYSQDPQTFEALAAARAANLDFRGAVAAQRKAIAAANRLHWDVSRMLERQATYSKGRMWYGDLYAVPPGIVTDEGIRRVAEYGQ